MASMAASPDQMAVDEPRPTAGGGVKSEIIEIGDRQSAEAHISDGASEQPWNAISNLQFTSFSPTLDTDRQGSTSRDAELSTQDPNFLNQKTEDEMIEMETIAVPKKALTHEVPLLRGALVIECNIPLSLLQRFVSQKRHEDTEFKSAKYSAITASPMLARQENFTLRQMLYPKPRQTEIILVLHISTHQDNESMGQTLGALFSCIGYMCSRRCGEFGKNGWKKLLICIVVDGRRNMSWTSRRLLSLLGLFHGEVMVESVQEKAVEAHMFEYTTQVDLDHNKKPQTPIIPGKTPVQMLLCLKEESRGHHEANLWLSEAVLPTLQPHMLVFIPPGLVPHRDAVYRMWKKFDRNESCGGAVGQTISKALSPLDWLRYPFFAASALEQKLIHTFDKPVASCLGSAPVFPTTFSAFRYSKPDKTPEEKGSSSFCDDNIPMQTKHARTSPNLSNFQEYMPWLMEPFSQHQIRWTFGYARQSKAYIPIRATDESSPLHVPISMTGYIRTQRRQIQDKAVFIRQYLTHARQLITVKHSYFRKLGIVVLLLYFLIDLFISWFAITNLFVIFHKLNASFLYTWLPNESGRSLEKFVRMVYILTLMISVILGLCDDIWRSKANSPTRHGIRVVLAIWACLAAYFISIVAVLVSETIKLTISKLNAQKEISYTWWPAELRFAVAICPILITPIIWVLAGLALFDSPLHLFLGIIQHVLLAPARINCFNISAFFNASHTLNEAPLIDLSDPIFCLNDPRANVVSETGRIAVHIPQDDGELNAQYEAQIERFVAQSPKAKLLVPPSRPLYSQGLVLTWALSNLLLCALLWYLVLPNEGGQISHVDNINSGRFMLYFTIVNWAIGGFWVCKFVGVLWYRISKVLSLGRVTGLTS